MHNAKAQASLELLAVLGIAMVYILFFAIFSSNSLLDAQMQKELHEAQSSAQQLADACDHVLSQGDGASETVQIILPPSTNFSSGMTYVGKPPGTSVSKSNSININAAGINAVAYTRANLTGSLPASPGTYNVNITSHGTFVNIGDEAISVSPSRVSVTMARSQTALHYVNFTSNFPSPVYVNVTQSWPISAPPMAVYPDSFVIYNGTSAVRLNFTTSLYNSGTYSGSLIVSAITIGYSPPVQMNFTIPVSVLVQEPQ